MKERQILMSAPMVCAIIEGRKMQTRRALKPQPDLTPEWNEDSAVAEFCVGDERVHTRACPYGKVGDRLWVRERCELTTDDCEPGAMSVRYLADGEVRDIGTGMPDSCPGLVDWINGRWSRPSIHMPRWACRITLEIVSVRVERLQDISYEDALAEGVLDFRPLIEPECQQGETADECARRLCWPQRCYRQLWESINGEGSWEKNPWGWAISFRCISTASPRR